MSVHIYSADFFSDRRPDTRGKLFSAGGYPLIKTVAPNLPPGTEVRLHYYYTQIEIVAALLGSVRLGLNPGEFADFVLGWFGVDFFHDDIGKLREPAPDMEIDPSDYD